MRKHAGFSLLEVVLTLGIFSVAGLGLLTYFGPMLTTIGEQLETADVVTVPTRLKAYWGEELPHNTTLAAALPEARADNPVRLIAWSQTAQGNVSTSTLGDWARFLTSKANASITGAVYGLTVIAIEASDQDPAWMHGDPLSPVPVPPAFVRVRVTVSALSAPAPDEDMTAYEKRLFHGTPVLTFFNVVPLR